MAETFLSIQEAAAISGKSIQTIRRAIKANKIATKKRKTAQGFNYMVTQESLTSFYKLNPGLFERKQGSLDQTKSSQTQSGLVSYEDLKDIQKTVEQMLHEYKKEKESLVRFVKAFQDRFVVMENQLKLIEEPRKKSWFHFWK